MPLQARRIQARDERRADRLDVDRLRLDHPHALAAQQCSGIANKRLRAFLRLHQIPGQERVDRLRLPSPEIASGLLDERLVGGDLGIERTRTLEGMITQHALAEAVDGVDRRLVERFDRERNTAPQRSAIDRARDEFGDERVTTVAVVFERDPQRVQAAANPLLQLGSGGDREGDDQDRVGLQRAFDEQPQVQTGDGPGLAGARARLDHGGCIERQVQERMIESVRAGYVRCGSVRRGRVR